MNFTKAIRGILPVATLAFATIANADYYACSNDLVNLTGSVVHTDDAGNVLATFGDDVLDYAISLAIDKQGIIYVADYTIGQIKRFLPNGTYLGVFATAPGSIGTIIFHPDGSLLVSRYYGETVWRFASDGTPMSDYVANNGLTRHGQMTFDPTGSLYVCSWIEQEILKYDPDGNPLGAWSYNAKSGITNVVGMAFDTLGQMYVSEYADHRIKLLDPDGFFISEVATTFGEIEFLTMGDDGNLFVPYFYNDTIHRFAPDGTDLGEFAPVLGTYQIVKGPFYEAPESFTKIRGRVDSGDVSSLISVDGNALRVCRFLVLNATEPPIQVNVKGTSSVTDPNGLTVHVTSKMVTNGLFQQEVVMIDENGALSPTVRRTDNLNTNMKTVSLSADVPSNFVAADGSIQIRYNIRQTGPAANAIWCHEVDQVGWTVTP